MAASEQTLHARGQPAILAEGVGKRFGDVRALDGVDLELPAGKVLALLGPNGAGKTTMVRILATLLPPDVGQARVSGFDVATEARAVRRLIGLSGQYAAVDEPRRGSPARRNSLPDGGQLPVAVAVPALVALKLVATVAKEEVELNRPPRNARVGDSLARHPCATLSTKTRFGDPLLAQTSVGELAQSCGAETPTRRNSACK